MQAGQVIDMHSDQAADLLTQNCSHVPSVQANMSQFGRTCHSKEMLLAWRGSLGIQCWEVVNEKNGQVIMSLEAWLTGSPKPDLASDYASGAEPSIASGTPLEESSHSASGAEPSSASGPAPEESENSRQKRVLDHESRRRTWAEHKRRLAVDEQEAQAQRMGYDLFTDPQALRVEQAQARLRHEALLEAARREAAMRERQEALGLEVAKEQQAILEVQVQTETALQREQAQSLQRAIREAQARKAALVEQQERCRLAELHVQAWRRKEEEERRSQEEQAQLRLEEEARLRQEQRAQLRVEEEAMLREEERFQQAKLREEERAKLREEEEERIRQEEQAKLREQEVARRLEEEQAKFREEEEAKLREEERFQQAKLREEERAKLRDEEEERIRQEEQAKLREQQEALRRLEDDSEPLKSRRLLLAKKLREEEEAKRTEDDVQELMSFRALQQERVKLREEEQAKQAKLREEEKAKLREEEQAKQAKLREEEQAKLRKLRLQQEPRCGAKSILAFHRRQIIACLLKEGDQSLPSDMCVHDDPDDHRWTLMQKVFKDMPMLQERSIGRNTQLPLNIFASGYLWVFMWGLCFQSACIQLLFSVHIMLFQFI